MRSIHRTEIITQPATSSAAWSVRQDLREELLDQIPELKEDSAFDVAAEPRGTYIGVTVFVGTNLVEPVRHRSLNLERKFEDAGYPILISVRTGTN